MRISAAASGTFRQRTNAFVRRADSSKSAGSRVRTYSHCPSCRDNAAIRPDYRNAPKASILILTPMKPAFSYPPAQVRLCHHLMRVDDELLGRAFVEILVALGRVIE